MLDRPLSILAIAQSQEESWRSILTWSAVLVGALFVGMIVVAVARRMMQRSATTSASAGFTLDGLRRLHATGQLTDEEFRTAKERLVSRLRPLDPGDPAVAAVDALKNRSDKGVSADAKAGRVFPEREGESTGGASAA